MIYLKFNRLNLDFLADPAAGEDAAKKRTRLFQYLSERSFAYPAMLTLHRLGRPDVVVDGGLPRILGRLNLAEAKSTSHATRQRLMDVVPEADLISLQFLLYLLSEDACHVKAPSCPDCPLNALCPAGKQEIERARVQAEAQAVAAAKVAKKQAQADKKKAAASAAKQKSKGKAKSKK